MKKAFILIVLSAAFALFSCQKEEKNAIEKTPSPKKQELKFLCGADDVTARFSDLINKNNKAAQERRDTRKLLNAANNHGVQSFVIYIDADGSTLTDTYWNYYFNNSEPITATPTSLTKEQLNEVKQAVEDDFSPWAIKITFDEAVYNAADPYFRTKCILTNNSKWLCGGDYFCYGGIAYIGSGFWGNNTPCFVFPNALSDNAKFTAEAVSHEVGHTLRLLHQSLWNSDCQKIAEYNWGTGYGPISFAPIMGTAYYARISNWFSGTDSRSCYTIQNDFDLISENIPLVADVEGVEVTNGFVGVLNYGKDVDVNNLSLKGGGTTIKITSENADLKITLYRNGKKVVSENTNKFDTDAKVFVKGGGKFKMKVEAVSNENVSNQFMTGKYHISIH